MVKEAAEIEFSRAKAGLSEVMTEVVHRHRAMVIDRHGGRERALLIGEELAEDALGEYRFAPEIIAEEGEVTARLAEFGLLGFGETVEEAMGDLARELDVYADRFLGDYSFYRRTKRAYHLPCLLRFKVTSPARRRELLLEDSKAQIVATR
jgi:antitoxin YefM